jgi:hypothetical protein
MTQHQIRINVKIAAVAVFIRISLSYPKEVYVKIIQNSKLLFLLHSLLLFYPHIKT